MFLIERILKNEVDSDALGRDELVNVRVRVDDSGSQVVAMVCAASREQAESIVTEILGE